MSKHKDRFNDQDAEAEAQLNIHLILMHQMSSGKAPGKVLAQILVNTFMTATSSLKVSVDFVLAMALWTCCLLLGRFKRSAENNTVLDNGKLSDPFGIFNGTKQMTDALMAHTLTEAHSLFDCFRTTVSQFGLTSFWNEHSVQLDTKVAVYKAVIPTVQLYGSFWTIYHQQIDKLDQFHMCLHRIAHIK
ncbi:Tyrosine--tRNA ligase 2 [Labeo rohita]|uniref:Tyrosine--tRNA ligase 2 n=1 Tax=Labeo rohita TaxID=84645 RepID=A0ABQ8M3R6_LABRO|nr:Tyrosine--tRNA ligase 2 [Labeo rohita]